MGVGVGGTQGLVAMRLPRHRPTGRKPKLKTHTGGDGVVGWLSSYYDIPIYLCSYLNSFYFFT